MLTKVSIPSLKVRMIVLGMPIFIGMTSDTEVVRIRRGTKLDPIEQHGL